MPNNVNNIESILNSISDDIDSLSKKIRSIGQDIPKEIDSLLFLTGLLKPEKRIAPAGGWAAPYETIAKAVEIFLNPSLNEPLMVELGGGVSTLWFAHAARHRGGGRIVSVEHDLAYLKKTKLHLEEHKVSKWVDLVFAPLDNTSEEIPGEKWYSLSKDLIGELSIDILFVDGPLGLSSTMARYPAYPVFSGNLHSGAALILDDVDREDEQTIVRDWLALEDGRGRLEVKERLGRSTIFQYNLLA